ncbi:MAG: hypothetical protein WAM14_04935 [Candidatus Nitrosopolaris sp.]
MIVVCPRVLKSEEALDDHKKLLEIHKGLDDRVRMAIDYTNIGLVL